MDIRIAQFQTCSFAQKRTENWLCFLELNLNVHCQFDEILAAGVYEKNGVMNLNETTFRNDISAAIVDVDRYIATDESRPLCRCFKSIDR